MSERRGTKALELWCRRMTEGYPGVKVDNMTTSWRDGLAFCAMIHHFRPDLIDFDKLNKSDVYYNNALAFTTAEKYLGIPALLDADDMAAYEVPDRLSILTYMSQYYQAFAAQDAHNRLKRPSSSATDKTQISKPTGPPPKMAHVVGVPRRDPCRKCQLPVFLAERLLVGKRVYHRTCLKCARCNSQLTPGSFYETEIDEQYCCETCPDEEITATLSGSPSNSTAALAVGGIGGNSSNGTSPTADVSSVQLRNKFENDAVVSPTSTRSVRSSIRDRLAFFEQQQNQTARVDSLDADSKLLQKSLSDEEKSKSLQRMENSAASTSAYKMNPALTSFLNDTVDNEPERDEPDPDRDEDESESLSSSVPNSKMETSDSEELDDLTTVSQPPELPKTLPPPPPAAAAAAEEELTTASKDEDNKRFTASAQLILESSLTTDQIIADEQHNLIRDSTTPDKETSELKITVSSFRKPNDTTNNNIHDESVDEKSTTLITIKETDVAQEIKATIKQLELENNLACNETNDNDCVTKDKATVDVSMETETQATTQLESTTTTTTTPPSSTIATKSAEASLEQLETSENVQVDDDIELRTKSPNEKNNDGLLIPGGEEDKETTQRLSVVRARLQQFEVITNNEKEKESTIAIKAQEPLPIKNIPNELQDANESTSRLDLEENSTQPIAAPREEIEKMETESPEKPTTDNEQVVPLIMETKDNEILANKSIETVKNDEKLEDPTGEAKETPEQSPTPQETPLKANTEEYPEDLNPFQSDDEDDENKENVVLRKPPIPKQPAKVINANPFDSSDDEIELEKSPNSRASKIPPPRPPPPRFSRNPFGSDDEDEDVQLRRSSLTASQTKRTPVPTPRSNISQSLNPTPEPTPRLSTKIITNNSNIHSRSINNHSHNTSTISSHTPNSATATPQSASSYVLQNSSDFYGSANSLHSNHTTPNYLLRSSDIRSSNNSLNLSAGGTIRSRKSRRAPLPPAPVKELFPSSETINSSSVVSSTSTPSSSTVGTPKSGRKKRPAPAPPKPARLEPSAIPQIQVDTIETQSKNLYNYPLRSESDSKLSDEEKALLEGKMTTSTLETSSSSLHKYENDANSSPASRRSSKRLIPLDLELLEEHAVVNQSQCDDLKQQQHLQIAYNQIAGEAEEANVVYRRLLIPNNIDTPTHETNPIFEELNKSALMGERQLEKLKDNKEANNRNRQSQISAASSGAEDNDPLFNKSVHGKWKRRKGPAPALPIPPRKVLQMLPLQEIKHELDIIEVQQQGLEKQGVVLEKMIRDRCEGQNGEPLNAIGEVSTEPADGSGKGTPVENSKEVEYLILQLFELVNEKNELFRRQAELMYLRRQHRLEQEQADLEYEIRVLMAQPERNKTDSDKAREEALIERLVEVVQLRNEVVECLEMDRLREAEEDQSIKQRMESHIAKRDDESETKKSASSKLSKKEKKKQKESKKLAKNKKLDADKDADESEINLDKQKIKKKKKLLIF